MIELRDYQLEALEAVLSEHRNGISRQIVSLPTGTGKTVIMGAIAKQLNKKTILLAHREELITQAVDKFKLVWPSVDIGICMADQDEIHNQVVIASIQSASRPKRINRLKEQGFEFMMVDEAHHSVSQSYQNVINELGFANKGNRLLLGMTATPLRADKKDLGNIFEKITFSRSIGTMIKAGYLAPVFGRRILTNFNFERIRSSHGDFVLEDLSEAVNTTERNAFIVDKYKEYANDRKAIAFCCDVQHSKDLADAFKRVGFKAESVYGDMPSLERKNVLKSLKSGKIQIATSCGVLCEGYDEPSVDAVIMARPTKSAALYTQCVGRGLRLWPGKENCCVLDFTDRIHSLDAVMTLSKTIPEAISIQDREKIIENEEIIDRTPKINVIESCDREFDILGSARFIWIPLGNNEWSLIDDERHEIVMTPFESGFKAVLYLSSGLSKQIVQSPLPLEYCSGVCEDYARRHLKIAFADAKAPWMRQEAQPTKGQRDFLAKNNAWCEGMTKALASIEIRKIIALKNKQRRNIAEEPITNKQKYFLINNGINADRMNKFQAMQAISRLKQNEIRK